MNFINTYLMLKKRFVYMCVENSKMLFIIEKDWV